MPDEEHQPSKRKVARNVEHERTIIMDRIQRHKDNIEKLKPASYLDKSSGCPNFHCQYRLKSIEYDHLKKSYDNLINLLTLQINDLHGYIENKIPDDHRKEIIETILLAQEVRKAQLENAGLIDEMRGMGERINKLQKIIRDLEERSRGADSVFRV